MYNVRCINSFEDIYKTCNYIKLYYNNPGNEVSKMNNVSSIRSFNLKYVNLRQVSAYTILLLNSQASVSQANTFSRINIVEARV